MKDNVKKYIDKLEEQIRSTLGDNFLGKQVNQTAIRKSIMDEYQNSFPPITYKIICDDTNNSQEDIDNNIINIDVCEV
jgi:hypothetical protein